MTDPSPTPGAVQPSVMRLDPSPSRVFSWLFWEAEAEAVFDEVTGRVLRPAGPTLTVRYRYNGAEHEFFPVSIEEARSVFNPGPVYDYSIGSAFGSIIKSHKSGRLVKPGERQETKRQREVEEKREGRRWLA